MVEKVKGYMKAHQMIQIGDKIIAGVSGGADSVCLLLILKELRESLGIEIEAVHVHHGLRGAGADQDEEYVKRICREWDIPVHCCHVNVRRLAEEGHLSEEEAARQLRYQCFEEIFSKKGGTKIAVAHHKEDCAETILFHLFRGSGLRGLGGIQEIRGNIIRPLLCCSRQEIVEYLNASKVSYQTDETNALDYYSRNKIRNHILKYVREEINEQAVEHIVNAGKMVSEADRYFERMALEFCHKFVTAGETGILTEVDHLQAEEGIVQAYIIRRCYEMVAGELKDLTRSHIDLVKGLLYKDVGKKVDLPKEVLVQKGYTQLLFLSKSKMEEKENFSKEVNFSRFPYVNGSKIPKNRYTKWFDCDKIEGTLVVRTRMEGDYIRLPMGGKKKIKAYMIDEKIPRSERDRILLLADGNHILWIIGSRISEGCKVTKDTENILQVVYNGGICIEG